MKLMTLSAGGYGSILQTLYLKEYLVNAERILLIDDNLHPVDVLSKYIKSPVKNFYEGKYTDEFDILVPSYEYKRLSQFSWFKDMFFGNRNDKRLLKEFVPEGLYIPYVCVPYFDSKKTFVGKDIQGSGSKNIVIMDGSDLEFLSNKIYQEYCPGNELILDCVTDGMNIFYTARLSIQRKLGRDTKVSFNIHNSVYEDLTELLSKITLRRYKGPFNLQLRLHEDSWKVMEIDFRLSGNSIINLHYDTLMSLYLNKVKKPNCNNYNHEQSSSNIISFQGQFNERCKSIYKAAGLSVPSVV